MRSISTNFYLRPSISGIAIVELNLWPVSFRLNHGVTEALITARNGHDIKNVGFLYLLAIYCLDK